MNRYLSIWHIFLGLGIALCTTTGCEDWDLQEEEFAQVITLDPINTPNAPLTSITLAGKIEGLNAERVGLVTQPGHVYSYTQTVPTLENSLQQVAANQLGNGEYSNTLSELTPGRTYYYRAYAFFQDNVIYGEEIKTFVIAGLAPQVTVDSVYQILPGTISSSARVAGFLSGFSEGIVLEDYGFVWGSATSPDITTGEVVSQGRLEIGANEIPFQATLSIIDPGQFYVRTYAQVGDTVYYSPGTLCFFIGDIWKPGVDFAGPALESAISFTLLGKAYVGTGRKDDAQEPSINEFWQYDPNTQNWTPMAPFPGTIRDDAVGFAIETPTWQRAYVGSGSRNESVSFSDFYEYNPATNTWREVDPLPFGLEDGIAFSINGKGYFGIAMIGENPVDNFYEYDPTDGPLGKWRSVAPFPGPLRGDAAAFAIDDKGYVTSGENGSPFHDLWAFDPTTGTEGEWTEMSALPPATAREDAVGFSVGGKGYLCAGWNRDETFFFNDLWEYDPTDGPGGNWVQKADFPGTGRLSAVAFVLGQKAYIGSGYNGTYFSDFWEYTPSLNCD